MSKFANFTIYEPNLIPILVFYSLTSSWASLRVFLLVKAFKTFCQNKGKSPVCSCLYIAK